MTNTIPRWYYRCDNFLKNYHSLKITIEKFSSLKDISVEEKQHVFNLIKNCYVIYWRFCRDVLKEKGEIKYFPIDILIAAQKHGIIKDSEVWLEFNRYRIIAEENFTQKDRAELLDEIIEKFLTAIECVYINISKKFDDYTVEHKLLMAYNEPEENYPNNRPDYGPESLNVSMKIYSQILQFFISHKEIKRVWLLGSRTRKNSDIDLLFDAPEDKIKELSIAINNMRVLNRFDIHRYKSLGYIKNENQNYKLIYRAKDFN